MVDSTTPAHADDAQYLRWLCVLGLANTFWYWLRPASLPSLVLRAPAHTRAMEPNI